MGAGPEGAEDAGEKGMDSSRGIQTPLAAVDKENKKDCPGTELPLADMAQAEAEKAWGQSGGWVCAMLRERGL